MDFQTAQKRKEEFLKKDINLYNLFQKSDIYIVPAKYEYFNKYTNDLYVGITYLQDENAKHYALDDDYDVMLIGRLVIGAGIMYAEIK